LPSCPGCPPGLRPESGGRGRGGAEGGSAEGGSDELREVRFSCRSRSATRASSRRFAAISSSRRISRAIAVSRSPSRMASALARSMAPEFAEPSQVPAYAHITSTVCLRRCTGELSGVTSRIERKRRGLNAYDFLLADST